MSDLQHFGRLKSLTKITTGNFDTVENIQKVIDPSQIIELSTSEVSDTEWLCMFTNLRSLSIESD
jgi:hypothetical protein